MVKAYVWTQGHYRRGCCESPERKDDGSEGGEKGPELPDGPDVKVVV